jgi:hypothetical protein
VNFADTNWLVSAYIEPKSDDVEAASRREIVERFMRHVDPMNWDLLRRECDTLFSRYAWKGAVGTLDTAVVASVKLAGGTRFLSFDAAAKAMAAAEGIEVYPALGAAEKLLVSRLRQKA